MTLRSESHGKTTWRPAVYTQMQASKIEWAVASYGLCSQWGARMTGRHAGSCQCRLGLRDEIRALWSLGMTGSDTLIARAARNDDGDGQRADAGNSVIGGMASLSSSDVASNMVGIVGMANACAAGHSRRAAA